MLQLLRSKTDTSTFFILYILDFVMEGRSVTLISTLAAFSKVEEAEADTKMSKLCLHQSFVDSISTFLLTSAKHKTFSVAVFQNVDTSTQKRLLFWIYTFCSSGPTYFLSVCFLRVPSPPSLLSLSPDEASYSLLLYHSHFGPLPTVKAGKSQMYYPWTENWFFFCHLH